MSVTTPDLDAAALLATYDAQLRAHLPDPLPAGATVERDGPLVRLRGLDEGGFITYTDLGGLDGPELDALIARQTALFTELGESVEWKLHGHDLPRDLPDRLTAAGFAPEERETVVVGAVAPLAAAVPVVPEGVRLREVSSRAELDRIARLGETIHPGTSREWWADAMEREIAAGPQSVTIVVAETDDEARTLVCAAWIRYVGGTAFGTLWGGGTHPDHRRRGIYKSLVAYRARLADRRGFTLLQVDASDESRPILERLGFTALTTTTPYVFRP
ncbi:GNAT family N-acetyltransferase [Catenuloplanes indicus]|uniref:GNAT superfamily N-acetyltransferase n=1 Tax=Catenuloplanes indicus TaxID=137267 RepID=A0AAE3W441_9ACTN|nr:GNAT family N-acetyltransferase [Catenuloplanes indicus]MDQ0368915.1 GNAT superfamily N-acetyltransferase [Catenuloplanes indicus]